MNIAERVAFYERGTDRVPFLMGRVEVELKLESGQIEIRAMKRGRIIAVQSSAEASSPAELGARPGSFGIIRERIPPSDSGVGGGLVFSHHDPEICNITLNFSRMMRRQPRHGI